MKIKTITTLMVIIMLAFSLFFIWVLHILTPTQECNCCDRSADWSILLIINSSILIGFITFCYFIFRFFSKVADLVIQAENEKHLKNELKRKEEWSLFEKYVDSIKTNSDKLKSELNELNKK